ncbi:hypothetical protein AB833_05035 [Chromatiales bacterium (ex Bugula neritina AB1)]|nr:hypothetical protein AB833_05035 [Chromatiales bacterium (ex Bugula neritina AB1)]
MIDWGSIAPGVTSAVLDPQAVNSLDQRVRRNYPATENLILIHQHELRLSRCYSRAISLEQKVPLRSVTKSVVSSLIGIALEQGKIASTEQTVAQLLPGSAACAAGAAAAKLTLHQVLSMTGGMRWQSGRSGNEPMHMRFMRSENWVDSILSNPVIGKNRFLFQYNTGLSHLLSAIISACTGMIAAQFASETLFSHLGIIDYTWPEDPQGISYGGWGLEISCIDMAKFGFLYAYDGVFNELRLLPSCWIKTSTLAHTQGYGYQWWLYDFNGVSAFSALGLGGQMITVVPDKHIVIVLTSAMAGRSRKYIELLRDHVYSLV